MKYRIIFFALTLVCNAFAARSQVSINGPSCVLAGLEYQYIISTDDTVGTGMHICLEGGVYDGTENTCLNDSLVSSVFVVWNPGVNTASISLNCPSGNATSAINITTPLQPGTIEPAYLTQTIDYDSLISNIACSAAAGGNCSPSYSYQWQQSVDNLDWNDIIGATNEDLDISVTITQTSYFRRKVTETISGSVAYTNAATVYVAHTDAVEDAKPAQKILAANVTESKVIERTSYLKTKLKTSIVTSSNTKTSL